MCKTSHLTHLKELYMEDHSLQRATQISRALLNKNNALHGVLHGANAPLNISSPIKTSLRFNKKHQVFPSCPLFLGQKSLSLDLLTHHL